MQTEYKIFLTKKKKDIMCEYSTAIAQAEKFAPYAETRSLCPKLEITDRPCTEQTNEQVQQDDIQDKNVDENVDEKSDESDDDLSDDDLSDNGDASSTNGEASTNDRFFHSSVPCTHQVIYPTHCQSNS